MADDLRALIAEALAAHVDVLNRDRSLSCTCGEWLMLPANAGMVSMGTVARVEDAIQRQAAEHRLHRADAILAVLDGRLRAEVLKAAARALLADAKRHGAMWTQTWDRGFVAGMEHAAHTLANSIDRPVEGEAP